MNSDLDRVIALQRLDSEAQAAERQLAEQPARDQTLDARLDTARGAVASAQQRLADSQNQRRSLEKEAALHQGRLSKFRDQAMAVKTNQEYQAIQKEIEFAQREIKALEDRILERMFEADELAATLKAAEHALADEQKAVEANRLAMTADLARLKASLERMAAARADLVAALDPAVLGRFELVASRRNGIAVAEARNEICTICHVRLRPQVFNDIRRNDSIIQCDSCQRILYYIPAAPAGSDGVTQPAS